MSKNLKAALSILAIVLFLGSTVGLVLVLTAGTGEEGEVELDVELHPREEIVTAAYKAYGDDQQNLWAAKTLILSLIHI